MKFKAVFFDCDGVLTDEGWGWERFCESIGISPELRSNLADQFENKEITYKQWIENYESHCIKSNLTFDSLQKLFSHVKINPEAREIASYLRNKGVITAIISSGLESYVSIVANKLQFTTWRANMYLEFTKQGKFRHFKEKFPDEVGAKVSEILDLCRKERIDPKDTIFVGDSYNDIEAFKLTGHGVLYRKSDNQEFKRYAWKTIDNLNEIKGLIA